MRSYIFAPLVLALSSAVSVAALSVSSPAINQCQDVTFNIDGAQGQVHLSVLPSVNPCSSDALVELGPFSGGTYTWHNTQVAAGTSVLVVVDDDSGAEGWSTTITVGGSASDCAASTSHPPTSASQAHTTAHTSATVAPVNAAQNTDSPNAALPVQISWNTGLFALLVGATFLA